MERIIFFDGVCNLCNAAVQFAIKRDRMDYFRYTALQGEYAKRTLPKFDIDVNKTDSIILLENNQIYTKSSAALRIAKKLHGLWPILYVFVIIPKFIRDWIYDIIAKNRYKWWGKEQSCWLPTAELKGKFYD